MNRFGFRDGGLALDGSANLFAVSFNSLSSPIFQILTKIREEFEIQDWNVQTT